MRYTKQSLESFGKDVKAWDDSLVDVRAPMDTAKFADWKLITTEQTIFGLSTQIGELTDQGYRTLCDKLQLPATWLRDKCPDDLRKTIFDRVMGDYDKECLFRYRNTAGKQYCRAVLSDRYMVYNHWDMWQAIADGIEQTRLSTLQPVVWKPWLDDYMSAWVLFEGVDADPDKPTSSYDGGGWGGLKPAIKISNAEDGTGRINLQGGMYRGYCSNGVVFGFNTKTQVQQVHMGNQTKLVTANIRIAIAETAHVAGLGIDKYIEATNEYINTAVDDVVDSWAAKYKLSEDVTQQWQGFCGRVTTWGDLVMATSDFGGTRKNREEMETFETLAGELLFAPHNQFVVRQ